MSLTAITSAKLGPRRKSDLDFSPQLEVLGARAIERVHPFRLLSHGCCSREGPDSLYALRSHRLASRRTLLVLVGARARQRLVPHPNSPRYKLSQLDRHGHDRARFLSRPITAYDVLKLVEAFQLVEIVVLLGLGRTEIVFERLGQMAHRVTTFANQGMDDSPAK